MIPAGDIVPRRSRPLATAALLIVLVAALALDWMVRTAVREGWTPNGSAGGPLPWINALPAFGLGRSVLPAIANVSALSLCGPSVEDRLGRARYGLLLVAAAVTAQVVPPWPPPWATPDVAGALAGAVMAAHLALFPTAKFAWWIPGPAGGRLVETESLWILGAWLALIAGGASSASLSGTAATLALGAVAGRWLPPAARLSVAWWDGKTASS